MEVRYEHQSLYNFCRLGSDSRTLVKDFCSLMKEVKTDCSLNSNACILEPKTYSFLELSDFTDT
jgi:hypothetical protein